MGNTDSHIVSVSSCADAIALQGSVTDQSTAAEQSQPSNSIANPPTRKGGSILDGADLLLNALKNAGSATKVPFMREAAGVLLQVVNTIQAVRDNQDAFIRLIHQASRIILTVIGHLHNQKISLQTNQSLRKLREIMDEISEFATQCTKRRWLRRLLYSKSDLQRLLALREELNTAMGIFGVDLAVINNQYLVDLLSRVVGPTSDGRQARPETNSPSSRDIVETPSALDLVDSTFVDAKNDIMTTNKRSGTQIVSGINITTNTDGDVFLNSSSPPQLSHSFSSSESDALPETPIEDSGELEGTNPRASPCPSAAVLPGHDATPSSVREQSPCNSRETATVSTKDGHPPSRKAPTTQARGSSVNYLDSKITASNRGQGSQFVSGANIAANTKGNVTINSGNITTTSVIGSYNNGSVRTQALATARAPEFTVQSGQVWDAQAQDAFANGRQGYDAGLFSPVETLDALSESEFTVLGHPAFPKSYTGYIDIEARHLFFYFFESRNDPDKDDVIFWTNGGPGCSSSLGLFMELGPCRVLDANGAKFHPESWNSNANIFFIDQPIGVGFSYADYGETVSTTEEAAKDIAAFVSIFFENFSKFKGRAFHMAGESYGGRYLPVFAAAVYDQNAKLIKEGLTPVNLSSVMIGNGLTDTFSMLPAYVDFQCSHASVAPVVDIGTCVAMKKMLPRCAKWFKQSCIDSFDAIDCEAAAVLCSNAIEEPFWQSGKNPYDISKDCEGDISDTLCYPITVHIRNYLSRQKVRDLLGVDPSVRTNFTSCSGPVGTAFRQQLDSLHPTVDYVAALLERNVRVLIYVGAYDWICNWVGNERWTLDMEWSGKEAFGSQSLKEWIVDGKVAGKTRAAKGLTFATIDGAGHMVPYDKPKESLEMLKRWLAVQSL